MKKAFNLHIEKKGPAVDLRERHQILGSLAAAYAHSASKEVGLQKASRYPRARRDLEARYGHGADQLITKAHHNAKERRLRAEEDVSYLSQSRELLKAGFPIDPEEADQHMLIALRRVIGVGRPRHERVTQKDRNAFMDGLYRPADDESPDQKKSA